MRWAEKDPSMVLRKLLQAHEMVRDDFNLVRMRDCMGPATNRENSQSRTRGEEHNFSRLLGCMVSINVKYVL